MKFSIITPSYNQGQFIEDSLESVWKQIDPNGKYWIEHIVIDGSSTDQTLEILDRWALTRKAEFYEFQYISEPDEGMTDAINKGFLRATGDWLMWLNTDDYLLAGSLMKLPPVISKFHNAGIVYGDCLFVDKNKRTLREKKELAFDFSMLLFYGCFIQSTACFIKRSLIDQGHLLDLSYKVTMDYDYYLRLAQAGANFVHIPEILAAFRWHGQNLSAVQSTLRRQERFRAQSAALARQGRQWLAEPVLLRGLFRWQQFVRVIQRIFGNR